MDKLVVFDLDDTLTASNMWEHFNTALGISAERDYELYMQFFEGRISYQEWTNTLQNEYRRDVLKKNIVDVLSSYQLRDGVTDALAQITNKYETAIISGGFTITAKAVAQELEIPHIYANTVCEFVELEGQTYFSHVVSGGDEEQAKLQMFTTLVNKLQIDPQDCIAIGDGANDIPLFTTTGKGVTFADAKPHVQAAARATITNFAELPKLVNQLLE